MNQTLEDVLTDMVMHLNTDRAALVRPAQAGKPAAVCVLMTSKRALRVLCKPLVRIASVLGTAAADFGSPGISQKIEIGPLFDIVDLSPHGWCWAEFKFFELDVTLAIFCRSIEEVAKVCNAHHAPCSLDPDRAAESYRIDKVLQRS